MAKPSAYTDALIAARRRNLLMQQAARQRVADGLAAMVLRLEVQAANWQGLPLDAARTEALLRQARALSEGFYNLHAAATAQGVDVTLATVAQQHEAALAKLAKAAGVDLPIAAGMAQVNDVALARMATRRGVDTFRSLLRSNLDSAFYPQLQAMVDAAVGSGVGAGRLTADIAQVVANGHPEVATAVRRLAGQGRVPPQAMSFIQELHLGVGTIDFAKYGVDPTDVTAVRTLFYNARRIAVTEINNSLREGNVAAMTALPVVRASAWQLSGRHPVPDECDIFAEQDLYGYGPGLYAPEKYPAAPHPHCACYQGAVDVFPPSQWQKGRPPPNPLQVNPTSDKLYAKYADQWTPNRLARAKANVSGIVGSMERAVR